MWENHMLIELKISRSEDQFWFDEYHNKSREDGPAIIGKSGVKYWYRKGNLHCLEGPAISWPDGYKEYWIDGKFIQVKNPIVRS